MGITKNHCLSVRVLTVLTRIVPNLLFKNVEIDYQDIWRLGMNRVPCQNTWVALWEKRTIECRMRIFLKMMTKKTTSNASSMMKSSVTTALFFIVLYFSS